MASTFDCPHCGEKIHVGREREIEDADELTDLATVEVVAGWLDNDEAFIVKYETKGDSQTFLDAPTYTISVHRKDSHPQRPVPNTVIRVGHDLFVGRFKEHVERAFKRASGG